MPKFKFKPRKNIDAPSGFTNGERAERGEEMAGIHPDYDRSKDRGDDLYDQIKDALTDFYHFLDREGIAVYDLVESARSNWLDER